MIDARLLCWRLFRATPTGSIVAAVVVVVVRAFIHVAGPKIREQRLLVEVPQPLLFPQHKPVDI